MQGFTPTPLAKVQYYNVSCPEGHRLRGERTEGYQALRCPTCGAGIFVLPRSPLPAPTLAANDRRVVPKAEPVFAPTFDEGPVTLNDPPPASELVDVEQIGEIEWLDEPQAQGEGKAANVTEVHPVPPEAEPQAEARPQAPERRAKAATKSAKRPSASEPAQVTTPRPRAAATRPAATTRAPREEARELVEISSSRSERLKQWASEHRMPLLLVSVVLIVLSTIGYRVGRSRFQELPRIAEQGREQGLPALDTGKFDTAQQFLSEASRAVDTLGGQVEGAEEIRQGAREAAIFTNLVPDSLEAILADASADPKERDSRFGTLYRGRSIIIDANIVATPDDKGNGRFELDYRIVPVTEGSKRVGRLDLSQFRLFEDSTRKVGDHVIFGARLSSLTLDSESGDWLFGLAPESGVYMTHYKALESFGWPSGTEVVEEAR